MLTTTLLEIKKHSPCESGWKTLTEALGENWDADEPIQLLRILETNGIDDAIWALRACRPVEDRDRIARLFACRCARQVWHLLEDDRSRNAVEVAERFANGAATQEELTAACGAAYSAAFDAYSVAYSAARAAARDAAYSAAYSAAYAAAKDKQQQILIDLLEEK